MAGHSKWHQIRFKKALVDAKRGKLFTRLIREITVAARMGGADPASNPRLRLAVDRAWDANMPKDNVERAIKKGSGEVGGDNYEEIRYEGYGPGGVAVMVDCLSDNRMRTVSEVRHAFNKHGGNLGTDGSVAYQFRRIGQILVTASSEEAVMELALEAGAEDVIGHEDGTVEVLIEASQLSALRQLLRERGFAIESAEVIERSDTLVEVSDDDLPRLEKLLEVLESLDDVQQVHTNC